ncbi:hypothetical protein B0H11DRAFT_2047548 [Mycena galericulata]|nr:hypothetical protein B0H11DRAFT_2058682 [Mycena galericulata]KAJ7466744.1 hypothetical protein B0H11DRAFT_2047548 [Mycena galericulata]
MSTAKDAVISTPELLELTLAQLPMRDLLLTAPLVSKTWQAITLASSLQRALFFEPDPSASEPVQNPLLAEMFPPFFGPEGRTRWSWPGRSSTIMAMPWSKAPDEFRRKEASWRQMLVCQPPVQTMVIKETCHGRAGNFTRRAELNDLSLRMGHLYDLAVPFIDRIASTFCIHWQECIALNNVLTLSVLYTTHGVMGGRRGQLDKRFYSDKFETVEIQFEEFEKDSNGS